MTTNLPPRPTRIHLVPHTHWDREWYRPFQAFRMQLVDLVDRVLDMLEAEPDFAFTLDGQLATVDDYLEIRPDQAGRIARHVASGRLAIGPWQILMDEFLVSGETLVRNLETGWTRAEAFGGPMRAGYLPDMFGHVAQMPQILRRAGIEDAVVWRGVPASIDRHAFRWEAPDGSWVRAEYLASGYGNAAYLFAVPDRLDAAAARFAAWARPWFGDDAVLAMYGTDHTAPVPELATLVTRLNEVHRSSRMGISTLAGYLAAAPALDASAPCWRGEMRSGARANVLMGVASAHMDIKRAAGRAETVLERYAEPLTALHVAEADWPETLFSLAWRRVIDNSAHDSICGCSVDPVTEQVLVRFAEADQIATSLTRRAAGALAAGVPANALLVVNPTPASRSAVVSAQLRVPDGWASVALELPDGSLAPAQELARKESVLFDAVLRGDQADDLFRRFHGREVFDHAWNGYRIEGRTLLLEVDTEPDPVWLDVDGLRTEVTVALGSAPDDEWRVRIVAHPRRTIAATVPAPALGWTAVRPVMGTAKVERPVSLDPDGRGMRNALLSVRLRDDGTFDLATAGGTTAEAAGRIVDGGDFGDSYNYAPPASDRLVEWPATVAVSPILAGPIRAALRVVRRYDWPIGVAVDGSARTDEAEATEVVTELELHADEPFVRVAISFENRSDDHRVRFHVPLPQPATTSRAEGQFAVVERGTRGEGGYREEPLATYPAHGWVDAGGMAILLDHVAEYELVEMGSGSELALTVLRSVGLISRNDNPYRQDPAGPQLPIPGAQMRGPWRMCFALFPHPGTWQSGVAEAAERYRHPFTVVAGSAPDGAAWPPPAAGRDRLRLDGAGVALSSVRRRAEGWLEVRVVNLTGEHRPAGLAGGITEAREANLRGEAGERLPTTDGFLPLDLGPAEIRTIQLRLDETLNAAAALLGVTGPRLGG